MYCIPCLHILILNIHVLIFSEKALCYPNPCKNGATCIDRDDAQFECSCALGFKGDLCEGRWVLWKFCELFPESLISRKRIRYCRVPCVKLKSLS